ncbi:MAG: hypothetical protein DWQ36_22690 [Acidobacteria bacterium]|nr:MAG: hypothetical protein DWQ30_01785 [Acidobacteriota bacterium]REK00498.1 MAG: hypothetical protein DWQ36_22690 [Acidobacteriota bacterium]
MPARVPAKLLVAAATLAAAGAFTPGCSDSSPTAPAQPTPSVAQVVFADDAARTHEALIVGLVQQTAAAANQSIPIGSVLFTVASDAQRTIPGWGLGGYTLSDSEIEIVLDPQRSDLASLIAERLPLVTAHELHHVVRWRGPGPYVTLLEALVFEGLADHFALDLVGGPVPPWIDAFPESQDALYLARAEPELDAAFDFGRWFFGFGDLPRWTGYTLGFRLVGDYIAAHPGSSAASLVHARADVFRP